MGVVVVIFWCFSFCLCSYELDRSWSYGSLSWDGVGLGDVFGGCVGLGEG